ncbi:unnamed protein product [Darwinula stevensoni]|uniref:DUF7027 domain-containing protein n=1 Tax=Darwinula stevensoni TaxID=69355 RepID=A0A7R8XI20_9CRUS|nr:unnamed protein product [Darwinula stevensoni]CAG0893981.1 unnamed protein product [Darwinula stevensoni]
MFSEMNPDRTESLHLFQIFSVITLMGYPLYLVGISYLRFRFCRPVDSNCMIGATVVSAVSVVAHSLLIHGIRKAKRKLMIPWLCLYSLFLLLILLSAVILLFSTILYGTYRHPVAVFLAVVTVCLLVSCPVAIHFFIVVFSYFRELENVPPHRKGQEMVFLEEPIYSATLDED